MRNLYDKCSYDQRNYQSRYRSDIGDLAVGYSVDKIIETDQNMNRIIGISLEEETLVIM